MTPKEIRQAHHEAAVRMSKFDRQPREVRDALNYGKVNARIPPKVLNVRQATALAGGAVHSDVHRPRAKRKWD